MSLVTKLYGDGRHRIFRFTSEGRALQVEFRGGDYEAFIKGYGTEIPIALAERLFVHPGSGIRFPGGMPKDAHQREQFLREKAATATDKQLRGEREKEGTPISNPDGMTWPTLHWGEEKLVATIVTFGVKQAKLKGMTRAELVELCQEKMAERYPEWAEQKRAKKKGGN